MKTNKSQPPLLPKQWFASYVTFWAPMKKENFISSGCVWFDYELEVYRIDGIFNPWDVEKTGHQLWMSEITSYGQGKSKIFKLPYHVKNLSNKNESFEYEVGNLTNDVVERHNSIVPRDILISGNAKFQGNEKIFGVEVDCWKFDSNNPFQMECFYLKKHSNELIRMTQFKNGQLLIRDLPVFSTQTIDQTIFATY
ncbi:hypothetical protein NIES4071_25770 [Calothrix sp. NIES-4071]|nr:hypothetical protein NIES4071_25770 [Calothrix sp. NIES-4071]BAZ56899.1 hypothetical protein NIES4105_25710 [Calothrix sp. NIES-4105]